MTRAIIYTRTSTGEQSLGHQAQEMECRVLAERLGAEVVAVYSDTISGSVAPADRDGFISALNSLQRGDVLLMWRRDRLGRSLVNNAVAEKLTAARGARVITSDVSSEDSAEATMLKAMLDAVAEYERAIIIARTKAALAAKKAKGLRLGNIPRGYTTNTEGEIMPNKAEQETINKVRAKRAEGFTIEALVVWCAEQGITSRSGRSPSRATIGAWVKGTEIATPIKRKPLPPTRKHRSTLESRRTGLKEMCWALREQGKTFREIALAIEQMGFRNSKGGVITHSNIHRLMSRESSGS